jgi:hypothetical protein
MGHWHDARDPRDQPGRVSAEHDAVERGAGAFLNPQNFANTIGKPRSGGQTLPLFGHRLPDPFRQLFDDMKGTQLTGNRPKTLRIGSG